MGFTFILVMCLASVFCLAPLSLYLLWLAVLTRRERPTVVSGPWDFVGLVAGLSGFILFGGGLVLSLFQSNVRYWMRGNFESLRAAWGQEKVSWILLALLYLLIVLGWIAVTLMARRRSLVVYHVDPPELDAAIREIFDHMGRPIERRGNLWVSGVPLFETDEFIAGRTVTIRWIAEDRLLFQEFERRLREAARSLSTDENPATRWLMSTSFAAGLTAVCSFALLSYAMWLMR